jgi:segregation and condensation protein B
MQLPEMIEGVLFYKAAPMKIAALARFFEVTEQEVHDALEGLKNRLEGTALRILVTDTEAGLVTAPELSETIEKLRKDDFRKDIGKAGAETLAIILYRGPLTRAEIDSIRGVNSTFILRNLLVRGLIERRDNPKDQRTFLYASTPELLAHLGITKREDLPGFADIMNALDTFESEQKELDTSAEGVFAEQAK